MAVIQTSLHPPVKVEPATARTISNSEPESVARETVALAVAPRGIPLNFSTSPTMRPPPGVSEPVSPTRIPFTLPPNGTGGSAPETVPASSGPSVPTSAPATSLPARIPFKMSPPSDELKSKLTFAPSAAQSSTQKSDGSEEALAANGTMISLGLRAVLQNMPAFQLNGSPEAVAADTRIELPLP